MTMTNQSDTTQDEDVILIRMEVQLELLTEAMMLLLLALARKPVGEDSPRTLVEAEIVQNLAERVSALLRDVKTYKEARRVK